MVSLELGIYRNRRSCLFRMGIDDRKEDETMERAGLTKNLIITELTRSPHGDYREYIPVCSQAAVSDPEFFAHFISYAAKKSQIRDSQIAFPLIGLSVASFSDPEFLENSLAHLAKLSPRELYSAYRFSEGYIRNKDVPKVVKGQKLEKRKAGDRWTSVLRPGILGKVQRNGMFRRLIARYLRAREADQAWLEKTIEHFRRNMADLYFAAHITPSVEAKAILYDRLRPCGSSLEAIAELGRMGPMEAASAMVEHKLPFLTVSTTLGQKARDPNVLMALIGHMSSTEVQTNLKLLEKLGVKDHPQTRAALEEALEKLAKSSKTVLKTGVAASAVKDEKLRAKVQEVAQRQIQRVSVEGNWAILADRSSSMRAAIEASIAVSSTLAGMVKGRVHLVFFNTCPTYYDVTGKSLEEIKHMTRHVTADGNTSIGCAMQYASKFDLDGISIVSDGGENVVPMFVDTYRAYCVATKSQPVVYFYRLPGDPDRLGASMTANSIQYEEFRIQSSMDYYSIPNLVSTMRVNRYSLSDEIMESRLITVDSVLKDYDYERKEVYVNA